MSQAKLAHKNLRLKPFEVAWLNVQDAVADQSSLSANASLVHDVLLQNRTEIFFILSYITFMPKGGCSIRIHPNTVLSSRIRRVRVRKTFVQISLKNWTVLGVFQRSVPIITLRLQVPRFLTVMAGVPAVGARLRDSAVLFVD